MEGDSGGNNMTLPDELVLEILSRLPVKSLLRFKCICKSWLSTITQPQFINTHLCRSTESLDCHRVLLNTELFSDTFLSINFEASNYESKSLECPFENSDFSLQAQCSCNGLILMSVLVGGNWGSNPFVLWNPSTRSHKRILCPYELPYYSLYGLCYDSAVDEYRVFIVSRRNETSVVVYSSRNDSWNIFIKNRYVLSSSKQQAVVNGAVHWVMSPYKSVSCVIVYFDLVEEKFKEVPPPSSWNKDDKMNLVVLGERLCVYGDIGVKQIEVYAMKEYGKTESWTRMFVIPCGILKNIRSSAYGKLLLCLTKNGQVLITSGEMGIGIYDPKDAKFFLTHDCDLCCMPISYVETLVSLPSKMMLISPPPLPPVRSNSAPPPPPPLPPGTQPPTRLITLAHHRQPKSHQQGQRQFAKSGVN